MHPVGFYDLRDTGATPVPVVSTAFRPIDPDELELNPFRVFTSMLTVDDERFFSRRPARPGSMPSSAAHPVRCRAAGTGAQATDNAGLSGHDADRFVELATAAFELVRRADGSRVVHRTGGHLGGRRRHRRVASTHINHLTPRVLDIDELYRPAAVAGDPDDRQDPGPTAMERTRCVVAPDVISRARRAAPVPSSRTAPSPWTPRECVSARWSSAASR